MMLKAGLCVLTLTALIGVAPGVAARAAALPAGATVMKDLAYGPDPAQRIDVYKPAAPRQGGAPVILMVHGGAWVIGDKANSQVVANKADHFLEEGFVFVSVNNRLLPAADPLVQADDVAAALAFAQAQAPGWGGDPAKFILMGHSAGAHLVALIAADPARALKKGAQPWRGTVALDSAAYDIPTLMRGRHLRLYDDAFGADPAFWDAASPYARLRPDAAPMLLVCSSRRLTACSDAHRFADAAGAKGVRATVLEQDLTHGAINANLGLPGAYTQSVDAFLAEILSR